MKSFAAPIIFRILNQFSYEEVCYAVDHNIDVVELLKDNPQQLASLRLLASSIPFMGKAVPMAKSGEYVRWFMDHELKNRRADLYAKFNYDGKAYEWLLGSVEKLSKHLLG